MTPQQRAEFLHWLNRLDMAQLKEVQSHVHSTITMKRGQKLRSLGLGTSVVFSTKQIKHGVGTVVRLFRTGAELESAIGERTRVDVDEIIGLNLGGGVAGPFESAQPIGFPEVPPEASRYGDSPLQDGEPPETFNPPMDWEQPT